MNVREGFARLARVTAILYGAVAVVSVGAAIWDGAGAHQEVPVWTVTHKRAPGWCFTVQANTKAKAISTVAGEVAGNEGYRDPAQTPPAGAECLWMGFAANTDPVRGVNVSQAAAQGTLAALWFGLAYGVLWATFRGVRWVALGFMEKPAA